MHSRCTRFALLSLVSMAGCGRANPIEELPVGTSSDFDEPPGSSDAGEEGRPGSCTAPLQLPTSATRVTGELAGQDLIDGWCGGLGGPEDVYVFRPERDTEVTIQLLDEQTEFEPILRVAQQYCFSDAGYINVCVDPSRADLYDRWHFFALAGETHYIQIDTEDPSGGRYAFDLSFDDVTDEDCPPPSETFVLEPGVPIERRIDLPGQTQGRVDTQCVVPREPRGAGVEAIYRVRVPSGGTVTMELLWTAGPGAPSFSIRRGCSTFSEELCVHGVDWEDKRTRFESSFQVPPGDEFLFVVDLNGYEDQAVRWFLELR